MSSNGAGNPDHLAWEATTVRERPALYGVAGPGIPVLFLPGWALGHHASKPPRQSLPPLPRRDLLSSADPLPVRWLAKVLPGVLERAGPNLVRNPRAMWRVASVVRKADPTAELEELKRRKLPVVVLWGERDRIIPKGSFDALC